jgi:hypothetical protein
VAAPAVDHDSGPLGRDKCTVGMWHGNWMLLEVLGTANGDDNSLGCQH